MPLQVLGATSGFAAEVESGRRALRVSVQPQDMGTTNAFGSYRIAQTGGTIAAGLAAASKVYSFRWAPTNTGLLCLVKHLRISMGDLVGFTAGFVALNMFVARAFSVDTTTGATQATLTGNNGKLRTSFPTSQGASSWISTTAAISGDTSTLDTMPIATVSGSVIATAGQPPIVNGFDLWAPLPGEWPLVLASQEGFFVKATVPATGTWQLGIDVQWDEVASF
jgi:hypothetical protein